jgi:3-dehydroquinate synthetase
MTTPEARVTVNLGPRSYDVAIGAGTLRRLGETTRTVLGRTPAKAFVAYDTSIPPGTLRACKDSLSEAGIRPYVYGLNPKEQQKSLGLLGHFLVRMASHRIERDEPMITLGGGLCGDLAGFAAAVYRRGIPLIQCPTTLLSMVDASVGGKTGVNLLLREGGEETLLKNVVGAFHQPRAVVVDVHTLKSLPDRDFRCGLAECIKHAMIAADWGDPGLADWTVSNLGRILARDAAALAELIARNVRIKAAVVAKDEREELDQGGRALLNLGHTFGHAIETIPGLSPDGDPANAPLQHGEAVALGLVAATVASESAGRGEPGLRAGVVSLLESAGLPTRIGGLPGAPELLARMAHDKKAVGGRLRLILPVAPGRAAVFDDVPESAIVAGWDAVRA